MTDTGLIFLEGDIASVVQAVLDVPMAADCGGGAACRYGGIGHIVGDLGGAAPEAGLGISMQNIAGDADDNEIPELRRAEGRLYKLPHILLFSVLAVITGGNSFRSIETFIGVHRLLLNAAFGLHWKRAPAQIAIRYILQGLDPQ